jgi:hypothetical protein
MKYQKQRNDNFGVVSFTQGQAPVLRYFALSGRAPSARIGLFSFVFIGQTPERNYAKLPKREGKMLNK